MELSQSVHEMSSASEDLVGVALVSHVPDDAIHGSVKHVVQRHRELDHAQRGAEVSSDFAHRVDGLPAELVRELLQLRQRLQHSCEEASERSLA